MWAWYRYGVPIWVPLLQYGLEKVAMCASSWAGWRGWGCTPFRHSLDGEEGGAAALTLARVGACADELRLMGVGRSEMPTDVGEAGGG